MFKAPGCQAQTSVSGGDPSSVRLLSWCGLIRLPAKSSPNHGRLDDLQLVALCLEQGNSDDRPAAEIFRRHRPLVWSVCQRYFKNQEDVADMVQETFFRVLRGLTGFHGKHSGQFPAWLIRVASNTCQNELRNRSRRPRSSSEELRPDLAVVASEAEARLEKADQLRRLHNVLDSLPEKEREILILVELDELPHREISDRLGLSLSAVKMRVLRARLALAAAFKELRSTGP